MGIWYKCASFKPHTMARWAHWYVAYRLAQGLGK